MKRVMLSLLVLLVSAGFIYQMPLGSTWQGGGAGPSHTITAHCGGQASNTASPANCSATVSVTAGDTVAIGAAIYTPGTDTITGATVCGAAATLVGNGAQAPGGITVYETNAYLLSVASTNAACTIAVQFTGTHYVDLSAAVIHSGMTALDVQTTSSQLGNLTPSGITTGSITTTGSADAVFTWAFDGSAQGDTFTNTNSGFTALDTVTGTGVNMQSAGNTGVAAGSLAGTFTCSVGACSGAVATGLITFK